VVWSAGVADAAMRLLAQPARQCPSGEAAAGWPIATTVATGWGPTSWLTSMLGYLRRKPSDGDACGRRFPVEGVVSPETSSTGENPVHSWTSDGGAFDAVPFLKASLWNSTRSKCLLWQMPTTSRRPVYHFFNGWVCLRCTAIATGGT
jgi:hypothetical protein